MPKEGDLRFEIGRQYFKLFVNRAAYTLQSATPNGSGKYYYYRPRGQKRLSIATILQHLDGVLTLGLYAINPASQRSKWVAIDADYQSAFADLTKLQWEFKKDQVHSALERSRRGAHLWFFAASPLLAKDCRIYVCNVSRRLNIPIKSTGKNAGIEIFPRQDTLDADEFGNAIRGPLGVHRGARDKRFWFYEAAPNIHDQLDFLEDLPKVTEVQLTSLVKDLSMPEDLRPKPALVLRPYNPRRNEFRILDHVSPGRRCGKDYRTQCPSCAQLGRDQESDNLAICISDPRKYRCWAGCTKEEIRAAVGRPIRHFTEDRAWQPISA